MAEGRHPGEPRDPRALPSGVLAWTLYLAVFLNGFEAGGYQSVLLSIGREFDLTNSLMGMLASAQLVAGLIAPLVFGPVADRRGKREVLSVFLALEALGCGVAVASGGPVVFVVAIFLVGVCTSIVQYTCIAGLADAYPVSSRRRIGVITSMYSLGAVIGPLACGAMLGAGLGWRSLFAVLLVLEIVVLASVRVVGFGPRESARASGDVGSVAGAAGEWSLPSVLLLCLIMFVYVGVESGVAFFLTSFVQVELGGANAYIALSIFWLAMIPSRLLCGLLSRRRSVLLVLATAGTAALCFVMSSAQTPSAAFVLSGALGFFAGAVYPNVLSYSVDFSGGRTATATGMITAATGLGGALIAASFGYVSDAFGMRLAFSVLGALMMVDLVASLVTVARARGKA